MEVCNPWAYVNTTYTNIVWPVKQLDLTSEQASEFSIHSDNLRKQWIVLGTNQSMGIQRGKFWLQLIENFDDVYHGPLNAPVMHRVNNYCQLESLIWGWNVWILHSLSRDRMTGWTQGIRERCHNLCFQMLDFEYFHLIKNNSVINKHC